jgi:hypothetical protein
MSVRNGRRARAVALAGALALAPTLGCGRAPAPGPNSPDTYTVRGEILSMPGPGGREALIRHEAVPDLRDAEGKAVGMASMTMPFILGADVDRSAFAPGDRVEFVLEVRWDARDPVTATKLRKLEPGTRLEFDPAQPAAAPGAPEGATPASPEGDTPSPPEGATPR